MTLPLRRALGARICGALLCLAAPAAAQDDPPRLLCAGTEPLWSLEMDVEGAVFTAPERPQVDYQIIDQRAALGRPWPKGITLLAPEDTAIALLRPQACRDGASDRIYVWLVDLLTQRDGEAVILTGCCREAPDQ